jgi:hypothetical protein
MPRFVRATFNIFLALSLVFSSAFVSTTALANNTPAKKPNGIVGSAMVLSQKTIDHLFQLFKNRTYITAIGILGFVSFGVEQFSKNNRFKEEPWMFDKSDSDFYVTNFEDQAMSVKAIYKKIHELPDYFFEPVAGGQVVKSAKYLKFLPILPGSRPMFDKMFSGGPGKGMARPDLSQDIQEWDGQKLISRDYIKMVLRGLVLGESFKDASVDPNRLVDVALSQILVSPIAKDYIVSQVLKDFLAEQMGDEYAARWNSFVDMAKSANFPAKKYNRLEPLFHLLALMEQINKNHSNPNAHISETEKLYRSLGWISRGWIANLQGNLTRTLRPEEHNFPVDGEEFIDGKTDALNKTEIIQLTKFMNISLLTSTAKKEDRKALSQVMMTVTDRVESVIASMVVNFVDIAKIDTPNAITRIFGFSLFTYSVLAAIQIFPPGRMLAESFVNGYDVGETLEIMGNMGIVYNVWFYITSAVGGLFDIFGNYEVIQTSLIYGTVGSLMFLMAEIGNAYFKIFKKWHTVHMRGEVEQFVHIARTGFRSGFCQSAFLKLHSK